MRLSGTIAALLLGAAACGVDNESPVPDPVAPAADAVVDESAAEPADAEPPVNPSTGELLPMPFSVIWQPWTGDYEAMVERRLLRVVVPYGGYQFYYENGRPRGAVYELVRRMESFINEKLGRRNVKVFVVVIPVSREELLPALQSGHADLVAADLTITAERSADFLFSRPLLTDINEVVVTGPGAPVLDSLDGLAGQEISVRQSSSYYEHLQGLADEMRDRGLVPPRIQPVDELLEAEDLLEILDAGMIGITVLDDYKAKFWSAVFPDVTVREDLVINEGGSIGWAMRKDTPQLAASGNNRPDKQHSTACQSHQAD